MSSQKPSWLVPVETPWKQFAACAGKPSDWFFEDWRGNADWTQARALCRSCAVLRECREYAVRWESDGFWGGLSAKERQAEKKKSYARRRNVAS